MEHEIAYLKTSKWHVKNIFMHLGFLKISHRYHTDQTVYVILEKPSNPSTVVLGAQKNQGDGSCEHP